MEASPSDDELMNQLKAGDKMAFRQLFQRHGSLVYGYCMRTFSGDRSVVDDVTQEVWLKVNERCETYQNRGNFRAWLMAITRNESINVMRKRVYTEEIDGENGVELADSFDLEDSLASNAETLALKQAIDKLPDAQRLALNLWVEVGADYESIGSKLGCSATSVRGLLHRARQALKKSLGG